MRKRSSTEILAELDGSPDTPQLLLSARYLHVTSEAQNLELGLRYSQGGWSPPSEESVARTRACIDKYRFQASFLEQRVSEEVLHCAEGVLQELLDAPTYRATSWDLEYSRAMERAWTASRLRMHLEENT